METILGHWPVILIAALLALALAGLKDYVIYRILKNKQPVHTVDLNNVLIDNAKHLKRISSAAKRVRIQKLEEMKRNKGNK